VNNDLSPVVVQDKNFSLSSSNSSEFTIFFILFSTKGDGSEDIHDQVGPEHLNNVKWVVADNCSSNNCDRANNDVDGKLELNELSNVVEDGESPLHRSVNRLEFVISNNKVG